MSIHISAKEGEIADQLLLPGDPLRAKFIAENFLQHAVCYNEVRGMLGFTGTFRGRRVSVQGTGMGVPSMSIYAHELLESYHAQKLIRVGTCGAFAPRIKVKDIIIAMSASTDSQINKIKFQGRDYAPTASYELLSYAVAVARQRNIIPYVGSVLTSDTFYNDDAEDWRHWAAYGCLAAEMEAAALYTVAAKFNAQALAILTVSDHFVTRESASAQERQLAYGEMVEIALETLIAAEG